jgi:hypothetical protein
MPSGSEKRPLIPKNARYPRSIPNSARPHDGRTLAHKLQRLAPGAPLQLFPIPIDRGCLHNAAPGSAHPSLDWCPIAAVQPESDSPPEGDKVADAADRDRAEEHAAFASQRWPAIRWRLERPCTVDESRGIRPRGRLRLHRSRAGKARPRFLHCAPSRPHRQPCPQIPIGRSIVLLRYQPPLFATNAVKSCSACATMSGHSRPVRANQYPNNSAIGVIPSTPSAPW